MTVYKGAAHPLNDGDIALVSSAAGYEEAALRAVLEVEARGKGFDGQGRLVALYEPHIAYREAKGAAREALVRAGLAYPQWRRDYPATSYYRIDRAIGIAGAEIACRSTSWGLGQVMGFNHARAGFPSAEVMVKTFADSEIAQLRGMVRFITSDPVMHAALVARNWPGFAERYNGASFKANGYHTKLAAAYARLKSRLGGARPATSAPTSAPVLRLDAKGEDVRAWQVELQREGFLVALDGDFGPSTDKATRTLQARLGIEADGVVGPGTRAALEARRSKPIPASIPAPRLAAVQEPASMSTVSVIATAVAKAVTAAAASPSIDVGATAIAPVTAAVTAAVEPVIDHLTNNEPWYRSRVTWGAIISAAVPILGAFGIATDWIKPDEFAAGIVAIGAVVGTVTTLYGRWKARTPIGA